MKIENIKKITSILEKDEAFSAGPVGISSVGYMNPVYSTPVRIRRKKSKKKR
ncbi:MAG: hypothetical protein WC175_02965 [Candidatus Dojkabacteria bacterium]